MSRLTRTLLSLLLTACLLAAVPAFGAPGDEAAANPWWSAFQQLWSRVVSSLTGDDGNRGPDFDPNGTALTETTGDGEEGNIGPDFDPNGLTVLPGEGSNIGPDFDPDGTALTETTGDGEEVNAGPDFDPNG